MDNIGGNAIEFGIDIVQHHENVRKFIRMDGVAFTLALLENNMSIRYVYIIANNWQMKP